MKWGPMPSVWPGELTIPPFTNCATRRGSSYWQTVPLRELRRSTNAAISLRRHSATMRNASSGSLVCQRYNNPSVAFWGIFADPEILGDDPIPFIGEMNRLVKSLDPGRLTVGISNKDGDVNRITDLVVWNHTFGWKTGLPGDIAIWRDQAPRRCGVAQNPFGRQLPGGRHCGAVCPETCTARPRERMAPGELAGLCA